MSAPPLSRIPDPLVIDGYSVRAEQPGFTDAERRDARDFAEAFFSRDGSSPPADRLAWFVADMDDFLGHLAPRARRLWKTCLATVVRGAPLLVGHVGKLGELPIDRRIEALERFERSPFALALFAVKALTSLVYYEHPDAAAEIGWDRGCRGRTP